jgi:hypothetical protein
MSLSARLYHELRLNEDMHVQYVTLWCQKESYSFLIAPISCSLRIEVSHEVSSLIRVIVDYINAKCNIANPPVSTTTCEAIRELIYIFLRLKTPNIQ